MSRITSDAAAATALPTESSLVPSKTPAVPADSSEPFENHLQRAVLTDRPTRPATVEPKSHLASATPQPGTRLRPSPRGDASKSENLPAASNAAPAPRRAKSPTKSTRAGVSAATEEGATPTTRRRQGVNRLRRVATSNQSAPAAPTTAERPLAEPGALAPAEAPLSIQRPAARAAPPIKHAVAAKNIASGSKRSAGEDSSRDKPLAVAKEELRGKPITLEPSRSSVDVPKTARGSVPPLQVGEKQSAAVHDPSSGGDAATLDVTEPVAARAPTNEPPNTTQTRLRAALVTTVGDQSSAGADAGADAGPSTHALGESTANDIHRGAPTEQRGAESDSLQAAADPSTETDASPAGESSRAAATVINDVPNSVARSPSADATADEQSDTRSTEITQAVRLAQEDDGAANIAHSRPVGSDSPKRPVADARHDSASSTGTKRARDVVAKSHETASAAPREAPAATEPSSMQFDPPAIREPAATPNARSNGEEQRLTQEQRGEPVEKAESSTSPRSQPLSPDSQNARSAADRDTSQLGASPRQGVAVDRVRFIERVLRAFHNLGERGGRLRIRLSPPELGSLRIDVTLRDGTLSARLEAETADARSVLLENLPGLRTRLAELGIKIDRFDVDLQDQSRGGLPDAPRQQHELPAPGGEGFSRRGSRRASQPSATAVPAKPTRLPGHEGSFNVIV